MSDLVTISFKIHKSKLVMIDAVCRHYKITRSALIRTAIYTYVKKLNEEKMKNFKVNEVVLK
jgi:metal-responsive CopG/Arc/MetJ family transcriptional regulator